MFTVDRDFGRLDSALADHLPDIQHASSDRHQEFCDFLCPDQVGDSYVRSFVPTQKFEELAAPDRSGLKRSENWLWAAVARMILNFHGIPVPPEQLVTEILLTAN